MGMILRSEVFLELNLPLLSKCGHVRQFFGESEGYGRVARERREQSLGSEIIPAQDGYILTNNQG
jgi:S1-C subfamily serine protease